MGVRPGLVAAPRDVAEVASVLSWANANGLTVAPCGLRTKLDRGTPPGRCDILLDVSGLAGIIEHAAGDMTVTVLAGTPLAALQSEVGERGQFLAIDPPVPGSVGGLIATGDAGPRRQRFGGVRDMLLGVTLVRADGAVARGGGRVVKNVAGYDLPKLMVGSLGTLGVIVEATFRLYPLPPASCTIAWRSAAGAGARGASLIAQAGLVPSLTDYWGASTTGEQITTVRFESSPAATRDQSEHATRVLSSEGIEAGILTGDEERALWSSFDGITRTDDGDVLARLVATIKDLPALIESVETAARSAGVDCFVRAHLAHGHALVRLVSPGQKALTVLMGLRREAEARGGSLALWRAPLKVRQAMNVWGDPTEDIGLMRRIKAQFDPNNTLNPGRFVGGI